MTALSYRQFRTLVPVRTLATQDLPGPLQWFMPLIKIVYWLGGVIELPPEDRDDKSLPEKLRGLLVALKHGDVVMIFPEGGIHRKPEPPVRKFAPGVIYVHKRLGAPILPIAVWLRINDLRESIAIPKNASPYLERMSLDHPHTFKEWLLRRALVYACFVLFAASTLLGQEIRPASDRQVARALNVLVLGDSILWGQGLKTS